MVKSSNGSCLKGMLLNNKKIENIFDSRIVFLLNLVRVKQPLLLRSATF